MSAVRPEVQYTRLFINNQWVDPVDGRWPRSVTTTSQYNTVWDDAEFTMKSSLQSSKMTQNSLIFCISMFFVCSNKFTRKRLSYHSRISAWSNQAVCHNRPCHRGDDHNGCWGWQVDSLKSPQAVKLLSNCKKIFSKFQSWRGSGSCSC